VLETPQGVNGRGAPGAVGLGSKVAFAGESLLDFLVSFLRRLLGGVVTGDGGSFGFRGSRALCCGRCGRSLWRGFRFGGGFGYRLLLRRGCLGRRTTGPRTNGEGRKQGGRKRDESTLQESSLHFRVGQAPRPAADALVGLRVEAGPGGPARTRASALRQMVDRQFSERSELIFHTRPRRLGVSHGQKNSPTLMHGAFRKGNLQMVIPEACPGATEPAWTGSFRLLRRDGLRQSSGPRGRPPDRPVSRWTGSS